MDPTTILAFCFPDGLDRDLESHLAYWRWFMRGGADGEIVERFAWTLDDACAGRCDHWEGSADGRMALVLVLDQFSRSVYRGTPQAYAQDRKALALVQEGLSNGDYERLDTVWAKTLFILPLIHAEGPDLLDRADRNVELADALVDEAPAALREAYLFCATQSRRHRDVIARFGRHPHRNAVLGRPSTEAERVYLSEGKPPHMTEIVVANKGRS